ncbi:hypothetical protein HD554DRAFT_2087163 [Boletus coccyginus]|nr:hypothetical protein HD554DRAFT_2087163 [Boletus coccyginus]
MSPNPHVDIHPLLNGEAIHRGLSFDVAAASFAAFQWITPRLSAIISAEKLREAAAYPPVTRIRITHDAIPWWPILINSNDHPATGITFPTTLGDVLHKIHSEMHKQVTQQEWDRTSPTQRTIIGRAYTQRYQNAPPSARVVVANQGVKRVDYLLKKHAFKGLIKAPDEDGVPHWRLVTA